MASWYVIDEEAPQDFLKLLDDDESEDFDFEYEGEEYLDENEELSEDEGDVEEVETSVAEGGVEEVETSVAEGGDEEVETSMAEAMETSEMTPEAEPYVLCNEPAAPVVPLGTISSVFDDEFRPLSLTSRSSSSPQASTSAAAGSGTTPVLESSNVVILATVVDDDSIAMEEDHNFHLADEHQLFQQVEKMVEDVVVEQPQQQRHPRRGGAARRRADAQRGQGRGRSSREAHSQMPVDNLQWVKGERLVEVFVEDEDVPEDLRGQIMNIVNAREVARGRMLSRERRAREKNEEKEGDNEFQFFFDAEGTSNHLEWSSMGDYQGEKEQFLPQQTGAVVTTENAYGAFRQYWDEGIMTHIATETNRYAAGLASSSAAFAQSWYDTNIHELFILFSFWMTLGIIRMPSIKSCFTMNPILQTNIFRKMFNRSRYENLCRAFCLVDNSSRPTGTTDPLFVLGPIIDHLNSRFQESYIPSQNICIDESLTLWKGNLSFRQYIKTNVARYGVKTYELCESSTGYLWSFFVYLGAGTSNDTGLPSTVPKSTTIVLRLIRPLLDKGYTLFMDNWFNSPLLARFLKTRKTDCVGTLRLNRTDVPPLMSLCKLKEGQFVARRSGDVVVLAFRDKKRKVATISTYHGNSQGQMVAKPYRSSLYKPQVVLDYNMGMGGVDRKDQMLEPYLMERKRGAKWSVKFFKRLLNCSIFNARVLLQSSTATPKLHIAFRLELVDQIMRHHLEHVPKLRLNNRPTAPIHAYHFPRKTDQRTNDGRRFKQRRCTYCSSQHKRRRNTPYVCSHCEVPLCVDSCFEAFHTM